MSKYVLVIVDAQKDFIDGSMGVGVDKWDKAKVNIIDMIRDKDCCSVIFTKDMHPVHHCSFNTEGGKWPMHCVANTNGSVVDNSLFNSLQSGVPVFILEKGKDENKEEYGIDVLSRTDFPDDIEIRFTGLCYDYCVESCAKITAKNNPNKSIKIYRNATVAIDDNYIIDTNDYKNIEIVK